MSEQIIGTVREVMAMLLKAESFDDEVILRDKAMVTEKKRKGEPLGALFG